MADAAISIKIGADTQAAVAGITQVQGKLSTLYAQLDAAKLRQDKLIDPENIKAAGKEISAITKQIDEVGGNQGFKKLSDSAGNVLQPLNNAYSAIRRIAYILPGIGIAGIFNLAFEAIEKLFGGLQDVDKIINKIKSDKDIIAEAVGGTEGDLARVNALAAAVTNSNLGYTERKRALDLLKETNKAYFGDLTVETATTETLTKRVTEYANALIQAAVVKGFTDEITKQTIEFNKQNDELKRLKQNYDDAQKAQEKLGNSPAPTAGGGFGGANTSRLALQQNELQAKTNLARDAFIRQRDSVEQLKTSIADYTGKIEQAINEQIKFALLKPPETPKPIKVKIEVDRHVPLDAPITFLDTSRFDEEFKILQTRIDKHPMILSFTIPVKESQDAFAKAKEFADKINGILTKGIESGIESVSRSIGDAFAGGNLGGIGKAFLAELGGLIEDLGRGLIELGGIKTALAGLKLSGPAYIALGIAAEILGSTIVSKAGKSHAFAEGGIVTGPVNALIGEAGPEVIFPLNELNKFVKGSTGASNHNVNVTGRISGNDLQLVLARNTKNQRNV